MYRGDELPVTNPVITPAKGWEGRIQRAEITGKFTHEDRRLAKSWTTCAVGELRGYGGGTIGKLKRFFDSPSVPSQIYCKGVLFYSAVSHDSVSRARLLWEEMKEIQGLK